MASPVLGSNVGDSGSSFCVSPIDEHDKPLGHRRVDSWTSAIVAQSDRDQASPSPPSTALPLPKTVQFTPSPDPEPTRWDDLSGEPTTNNSGKTSQVNPRSNTFHKTSGSHASNLFNWGREQLQPRKKLAKARNRIGSLSRNEAPPPSTETGSRPSSRVFSSGENPNIQNEGPPQLQYLGFVPTVVTTITAGHPNPVPAENENESNRPEQETSKFDAAIANMMQPAQSSRPDDGTNATAHTTTGNNSPGGSSNDSPHDSVSLAAHSNDDLLSVMSRRRPVPFAMPTSRKPVRKPTPSQAASYAASQAAQEPESTPPPPVEPAKDPQSRIMLLEARRDELKKRRFNLETVIHELTRVIQPGSITYDLAAKAEVKKSVQSIENEIAEIKREEHDLGMKVSRAWRRLDEKENNGDGSNLWVKRVTS
ncbi:hypothetical protein N7492_008264 [Penicillium capsulatum]|uniref:BHLH domain-containing protein n=1 Tax=Penicillium capsulatum TaxID=69766 RepID=A0A9W9HQE8_9EURO|nr:hypothetical protein N7492_008264 [Penicillium capsulatum]KAJ6105673.1 hypothetical protein N7512_009190 [Penicillium capsulatum]